MNKILRKFFYIVSVILFICSFAYISKCYYDSNATKKEKNLLNEIAISENDIKGQEDLAPSEDDIKAKQKAERILKVKALQKINKDIIGWIEIEGTDINYPVLQGSNNSYYLYHNYEKKYSVNGAIFLDKSYSWNPPDTNLLIYGHHIPLKDLLKYASKKFYTQHQIIRFTTNKEDANYEIISAFRSKVYAETDKNVFRYYYFLDSKNKTDYNNFVQSAKKASIYDTGKTAKYEEPLLTLSTCAYHTEDGRFVVVAKKQEE